MQLRKPIDSGQRIDSLYALRYIWMNWSIIGIHPPAYTKKRKLWLWLYYIYSIVLSFIAAFCFPASVTAKLVFLPSWEEVVRNLSLSATLSFATLKEFVVVVQRRRLLDANEFLKKLDLRCNNHKRDRMKILNAVRTCHWIWMTYMVLYTWCCLGFTFSSLSTHTLYFNAFFPTFFENPEYNYIAAFLFQNLTLIFTIFQNGTNDMYSPCYITLMNGHLDALAERIMRIGYDKKQSIEQNIEELKECVQDHKNILSFLECIRPVTSVTLFLQFCITALVLCLTAINLIAFTSNVSQHLASIVYLTATLIEVFPCSWYANVLMDKSDYLTTAMYSCNWMEQNQLFRKMLIIFMQRSQKSNIILAGNLAPVSLQTFLSIIRFSFSMYTIFSQIT